MSRNVSHLGYFPFCTGHEPELLVRPLGGPSVETIEAYPAMLRVPIKTAMNLYWRAKKARLRASFSYEGASTSETPATISINVDEEIDFYSTMTKKNEDLYKRICFETEENEPLLSFSAPASVGVFNFYLTLFHDKIYNSSLLGQPVFFKDAYRVFIKEEKPDNFIPKSSTRFWPYLQATEDVYVNIYLMATITGIYTSYISYNYPYAAFSSFPSRVATMKITIDGNEHDVELFNSITLVGSLGQIQPTYFLDIETSA